MDSGFDSLDNIKGCLKKKTDFIIKRNLRKENPEDWLKTAQEQGIRCLERSGKDVYIGQTELERGFEKPLRVPSKVRLIKAAIRGDNTVGFICRMLTCG